MSILIRLMVWLYAQSLNLYPKSFRRRFGEEMESVFDEAITTQQNWKSEASLFLHELRTLPVSILHAYLARWLQRGSSPMIEEYISPLPKRQALLGILPFLAFGISSMIGKADHIFLLQRQYAEIAVYGLALVGLLIGWIRGFPLWSYSYLGWSLLLAWSNTNMSIHGVRWGYQVWIPFGITVLIALLWTRSFTPVKKLLWDCWNDWTRLSLMMYAIGAWVWMIYDENHHPYLIVFVFTSALVSTGAAWAFLRSSSLTSRVFSVAGGFVTGGIISQICYATWDWRAYYGLSETPQVWYQSLGQIIVIYTFWLVLLFWPAIVGIIHQKINP